MKIIIDFHLIEIIFNMIPLINQDINQILILVITPAFFLTGIAGILSILSHRISRAVDRLNLIRTFEIDNKKTSKIEKYEALMRIEDR